MITPYPGQRVDHGAQYLTRYMTSAEHDEIYASLIKHNVIQPFSMDCVDGAHPKSRKYVLMKVEDILICIFRSDKENYHL